MTRKLAFALAAFALTLAVGVTAAFAGTNRTGADPGVTSTSILLGATSPLSGTASAYASVARGANAYFEHVNARGGVNGRKIGYEIVDDAYNPAQTVQATRKLVEQEGVFAIFNALGTEHNLAVREYLNAQKVPQLFAASGATVFGTEAGKYPYTIGFQPSYQAEGWVLGKYLARTQGAAKVAVLFQNDDYGKDLLNGLKKGIQRSRVKIVAAQPYEVTASDVQTQVVKLRGSGANTFAVFATPKFAIQAYVYASKLGWKPKLSLANAVSSASNIMQLASEGGTNKAVEGAVSIVFLKDPTDPRWKNDAAIKLYRSVMKRYAPGANVNDVYHVYGMSAAWTAVEAIRKVGKNLTREGLVEVTERMNLSGNPFLLPGIALKTGPGDHFPIEQMLLQRWHKGAWKSFGGLWGYRGAS
jgi:ABC-type branched-subunit amino acid transport system substrate-binding protein